MCWALKKCYYRVNQKVLKFFMRFMNWKEPVLLEGEGAVLRLPAFVKEKGISPLQFLSNTRINFAQKLLLSKDVNNYKIYEIAEMCGFTDQLYFSRVFKKITGVSPKEFTESPKIQNYNSD